MQADPQSTARADAVRAELAALHASEQSADGAVTVSVNAVGVVERLTFGPAADALPRDQLADLVVALIRRAHAAAAARQAEILGPVLGEDSAALAHVRAAVPEAPPLPPTAAPVAAPAPPGRDEDDEDGWESR